MEIGEVMPVLDQLRKLYGAGGAKAVEKDLAKLIECLARDKSETLDGYMARLAAAAAAPKRPAAKKGAGAVASGTKAAAVPPINESLVAELVGRLTQAGTDQLQFERVFATITTKPEVRLQEAAAIARQFARHHGALRTKKSAFEAIRKAFVERARFENKLRAVG